MNDDQLIRQFEARSLPFAQWNHRCHVRVAYLYLQQASTFEEALDAVRSGIQAYNAHHKVPETPTSGYHETMTHAFLRLIDVTRKTYSASHRVTDSNGFCDAHPQLLCKQILRLFYSPNRLQAQASKREFIEPDLTPLPTA